MRTASRGVVAAGVAALVALAWACNGEIPVPSACTNIPAGGCPSSFGAACTDPTCAAVYACTSTGAWSLVRSCPARDGGAAAGPSDARGDAPGSRDVEADVPGANGGPGCQDLQSPDCPLGVGLACGTGCCGCEDLFVCAARGWSLWGTCGDGGAIVPR